MNIHCPLHRGQCIFIGDKEDMKKYARKIIIVITILIFLIGLISFGLKSVRKDMLNVDNNVQTFLVMNGLNNCYISKFKIPKKFEKTKKAPTVTNEEIDNYIESILEENAYRKNISNRNVVKENDLAVCDYAILHAGIEINHVSDAPIRVGSGHYDKYLEEAILGLEVGKECALEWKVPSNTSNKEWAGKKLIINLIVKGLYEVVVPSVEEYAKQSGFENESEYKEHIRIKLLENRKKEEQIQTVELFINEIIANSEFTIDENDVVNNALQYYYDYDEMGVLNNMSVRESQKHSTNMEDEIYLICYEESLHEIQRYLVIGRYAFIKGITISDAEIEEYYKERFDTSGVIEPEELVYARYELLEKKVISNIVNNYIDGQ